MTFFEEGNRRIHMQIGKGADYRFSKIDLSIMAGRSGANQAKQIGFGFIFRAAQNNRIDLDLLVKCERAKLSEKLRFLNM
mgnify:CR=1 FL=1